MCDSRAQVAFKYLLAVYYDARDTLGPREKHDMPSGKVHAACSAVLTPVAFGTAYALSGDHLPAAIAAASGCVLGILLTPDLDQENLGMSERWLIKRTLGLGYVFVMLWYPYSRLLPHRSPWSHLPIVGTLGRLAYMGIFLAIALALGWKPPFIEPELWMSLLGGLALSDAGHWALDTKFGFKRLRPQPRR